VNNDLRHSIEFTFDESVGVLLGYERTGSDPLDQSVEEILRLDVSELRRREPSELQRSIGRFVLAFLNSRSSKGLDLPRDIEDERRLDQWQFAELEYYAAPGETGAIYDLAVSLIGRGISNENWVDIRKGERLLNQAADEGLSEAVKYREEVWSLIKPRLEQKFKRKPPG